MKILKREILGKKNKKLRKSGFVPAVIYDKENNIPVQIELASFEKSYEENGHTGIIKTAIDGDKFNLMIDHIQIDPVSRKPIHATLRNVNLKEELSVMVPVEYVNQEECLGVKEDGGIIVTNISEIEVTGLPTEIPSEITVDVTNLRIGEGIKVEDIKLPEGVRFTSDDENMLSQIAVTVTHKAAEEEEPVPSAEEFTPAESTKEKKEESEEGASEE